MENSLIGWTDHTFNPWIGCTKVDELCAHCYAETLMDTRYGRVQWGPGKPRSRTSPEYWKQPLRWNAACAATFNRDPRPRVFCASLADWLDDDNVPVEWLADLFDLVRRCQNLDWQLLTKRPENWIMRLRAVRDRVSTNSAVYDWVCAWLGGTPPSNVWIGTSVGTQKGVDKRVPEVLNIPARVRFLSCEPLLQKITLPETCLHQWISDGSVRAEYNGPRIHWVITGGESGPGARPMHPDWARSLRDQCAAAGVPFFFKQWGEWTPGENLDRGGKLKCATYFDGTWQYSTQTDRQSENCHADDSPDVYHVGTKAAGHLLDGVVAQAFPEVRA